MLMLIRCVLATVNGSEDLALFPNDHVMVSSVSAV